MTYNYIKYVLIFILMFYFTIDYHNVDNYYNFVIQFIQNKANITQLVNNGFTFRNYSTFIEHVTFM